jgi:TonB-linked SusC/RagA family outer membrane protein
MRHFASIVLFLSIIISGISSAAAQGIAIKGRVSDAVSGEPLTGATVTIASTNFGTSTDIDGNFSIFAKSLPVNLTISYIGYNSKTVEVTNDRFLEVALTESHNQLNEVVVVGYGTQKRQNLTSSVSTVGSDAFKDVPASSFDQVLQGRGSGIQITSPSGNLGTAPIVRVRGVASITSGNTPLYVVDGVPIQSGNIAYSGDVNILSDINPEDIESISILKDASAAALYGSRAANGVILITTKRGSAGNVSVTYDGWVGFASAVKKIDVLDAEGFVNTKNFAVKNRYGTEYFNLAKSAATTDGTKAFNLAYDANGNLIDTNWDDYVFQTGFQQSHGIGISGGTNTVNYHFSANYLDQDGILKGDHFKRISSSFNIDAAATKWLKIGSSQTISNSKQETADRSRGGNITAYTAFTRLAWANAPNIAPYDANGNPTQESGHLGYGANTIQAPLDNPVSVIESKSLLKNDNIRWLSAYYANITPIHGLVLRTQYGRDLVRNEERNFLAPTVVNGASQNGVATNVSSRYLQTTWTNTANYKFSLGDNNFDLLLGAEATKKQRRYWGAQRSNLVDNTYTIFEASYKTITAIDGSISENSLFSYFARVNYDFNSRYILSANFRRDGYSALSKNHRWGNFGGVSAAWRISQEDFFSPLNDIFNDFKVKASWGVVGNTNINDYASRSFYKSAYYGTTGAYVLSQIGDGENLKWESSHKWDIGFDAILLNNINLEFDYYNNRASDLILQVPASPSAGVPNDYITSNAGAMRNTGIELTIGADIFKRKDFAWTTSFNISTNANKVTELYNGVQSFVSAGDSETTNITMVGKSIGQLYLYPTKGIDPETGRRIFIGKDGTEVLLYYEKSDKFYTRDGKPYAQSNIERVVAGNTLPTYYGGWTNNFRYKDFDLTLFFQFSGGNKIYNGSKATLSDVRWWNNSQDYANNYWTPERTNAKYALPVYGDNYSNGSALPITDWVEDGDYLRLKNVVLGYTFRNSGFLKNLGVSSLRLYAQAQNLFVVTKYSGLDPEVLSQTQSPTLCGGTDHNTAPQARTFTFGAKINF